MDALNQITRRDALQRIEQWSTRDTVKKELDSTYQPPKPSVLDRILPK